MNTTGSLPLSPSRKDYRLLRLALSTVSQVWVQIRERRLAILIFHRVRPQLDPFYPGEPDSRHFADVMEVVAQCFNCLPLDEAVQRITSGGSLPPRAVAITFDDGYADNYTEAMPILQHFGLTATFFIASGFLDGGCMWNDEAMEMMRAFAGDYLDLTPLGLGICSYHTHGERLAVMTKVKDLLKYRSPEARREALDILHAITGIRECPKLMLTSAQVRAMHSAGMGIGGHTLGHPILTCLDEARAREEIGEDRERLTGITGVAPRLFAYPNGKPGRDFDRRHTAQVKAAGYQAAVTTVWGVAGRGDDMFQLPRFSPWDRQPMRFALRLAHNYTRDRFSLA